MKRVLVSLALAAMSAPAFSLNFRVGDIRLEGLQRVSASPVFAAMPVKVGDFVNDESIRGVMRELFATGFFSNIQVAREGDVLIVVLQERPAIKSIEIDGNKAIKTEQLTEVMDDNDLREGEILQRDTLLSIARELERQYVGRARYGASVETKVENLKNNMVKIDILVDEGKAAKIKHFNIVGNKEFSDKELLKLMELSASKWNSIFTSSDKYAKEKLTGDIETLESFYLDRGYLDFEVLSTQVSLAPDKESVYITLNVSEGNVYEVANIDIAGDPIISEERIRRLVLLKEGETFSQKRMTDTSEYMKTLLGNSGYTNAKVEGIPKKNKEKGTVDLTFLIDPGKRVYVRRIDFRGNTKTADDVLRREMRQFEGASASNARIEQSKVRLERLGFFKEVKVETKDVPGYSDLVDVEYTVEEQASGSISASIGYAQTTGVNLGLSVQQSNWLGSGKQVSFGINKNVYQTLYNFSYSDPYFTPDGVSRGLSLYYRTRDYDRINVSQYSTDAYGGSMTFGYPISEISRLGFSLGLVNQSVKTGPYAPKEIIGGPRLSEGSSSYVLQTDYENARFINGEYQLDSYAVTDDVLVDFEPGFIDKYGSDFNSGTFDISWSRMTLNRGILATRGSSQRLSFEATIPGSDMEYYKFLYNAQLFQPISRNLTLRFKTKLGYGNGYGEMDELPFFENFFGGGFGSVRGYERSTLGPKGTPAENFDQVDTGKSSGAQADGTVLDPYTGWTDVNNDGSVNVGETTGTGSYILCEDPTSALGGFYGCTPGALIADDPISFRNNSFGGNVLVEFSTELILPIPFIEDTRSMQLVAFVDAGNVFSDYCGELQVNCSKVDLDKLSSSAGFGFTWISGFGPMTFSVAKPLHINEGDRRD